MKAIKLHSFLLSTINWKTRPTYITVATLVFWARDLLPVPHFFISLFAIFISYWWFCFENTGHIPDENLLLFFLPMAWPLAVDPFDGLWFILFVFFICAPFEISFCDSGRDTLWKEETIWFVFDYFVWMSDSRWTGLFHFFRLFKFLILYQLADWCKTR